MFTAGTFIVRRNDLRKPKAPTVPNVPAAPSVVTTVRSAPFIAVSTKPSQYQVDSLTVGLGINKNQ